MSKRSLKFLFIPFLLAVFVAAAVFFVKNKPLVVNVVSVKEKVAIEVYGLGTIEARIVSSVGFEVGATLIELNVDQGDKIEKGAVLARLHSTEQEAKTEIAAAAVEAAKAKLEKAQAALPKLESTLDFYKISNKRSKALLPRGSIGEEEAEQDQLNEDVSAAELAIARKDVLLMEAELAEAQAQYNFEKTLLDHHTLMAPYDALIINRHKELGAVISPGEPVFTLVDPKTVWVLGYVDEARAGDIQVGQSARVRLRSYPNTEFEGRVSRIDIESDRVSEERRVYVSCTNCPEKFHLGEQAEIFVYTATLSNALTVPETAVEQFDGANGYIWIVQKKRLHRTPVTFGDRTLDGFLEITGGVDIDADIVTTHPRGLREGRKVIMKEETIR